MASSDIEYKTLKDFVQVQLDYLSANAPVVLKQPLGPFITGIAYAVAFVCLTLQRMVQLLIRASRLTTATGDDVDSFIADFGLTRNQAVASSGQVTFSRFSSGPTQVTIPVGKTIATTGANAVTFEVTPDESASNYDPVNQWYVLSSGSTSCTATVLCQTGGTIGNVAASSITKITSSLPGIDAVINSLPFVNGLDSATDDQTRKQFANYIQSLSKATPTAIGAAVTLNRPNLTYSITEPIAPIIHMKTSGATNTSTKIYVLSTTGVGVGDKILVEGSRPASDVTATVSSVGVDSGGPFFVLGSTLSPIPGAGVDVWDITPSGIVGSQTGTVQVRIDDGSGSAGSYISDVSASVNAVRPAGVRVDVTAAAGLFYGIVARVAYDPVLVNNPALLAQVIRSNILSYTNIATLPGKKLNFSPLYRAIFDLPDVAAGIVNTTIATSPASTTSTLYVLSTTNMQVGQLVNVGGAITSAGVYPTIQTIPNNTSITISPVLPSAPAAGTSVQAFSVIDEQVRDVHLLICNPVIPTGMGATLASNGGNTASRIYLSSVSGFSANQYLIITNETVTPAVYYQSDPAIIGSVLQVSATHSSPDYIDLNVPLGVIGSDGVWRVADNTTSVGLPPVGTKVVAISNSGGTSDITPSLSQVIRVRGASPNCLAIHMEPEV